MQTLSEPKRSVFGNYWSEPERTTEQASARAFRATIAPLQESINSAVARSFIYRFIAKAFEDPSVENWIALTKALSPFQSAVNMFAGALIPLANHLAGHFKTDGYDSFESDYVTCFGHTVRGDCPMNEIEYGDIKADPLFQPHRLSDLGAFYAAFGLEVAPDAAERHDHISFELEFMSVLAAKEAYALEQQEDFESVEIIRDAQRKFLREHLARWTPAFARRLARMAGDTLLGAVANFTREFLLLECKGLDVIPGGEDLLLRPVDEVSESLCASCGIQNLPLGASKPE